MFDVARGWQRVLHVLEQRRLVPADALTPAELARRIREQTRDERVEAFVWRFYYPRVYGRHDLAGTVDEAEQLVRAIEGRQPESVAAASTAPSAAAPASICPVCGRHSEKRRKKS